MQGIFVTVIYPLVMKKYASITLRKGNTDKQDAIKIARYGLDNWFHLVDHEATEEVYAQLRQNGQKTKDTNRASQKP